jgi:hypothetical protein
VKYALNVQLVSMLHQHKVLVSAVQLVDSVIPRSWMNASHVLLVNILLQVLVCVLHANLASSKMHKSRHLVMIVRRVSMLPRRAIPNVFNVQLVNSLRIMALQHVKTAQ